MKFRLLFWLCFLFWKHTKDTLFVAFQFTFPLIFLIRLFKRPSRRYFAPILFQLISHSLYFLLLLGNISDIKHLRQVISFRKLHIHLILFISLPLPNLLPSLDRTPSSNRQLILFPNLFDELLSALLLAHCPSHRSEGIWTLSSGLNWLWLRRFLLLSVVVVERLLKVPLPPADEFPNFLRINQMIIGYRSKQFNIFHHHYNSGNNNPSPPKTLYIHYILSSRFRLALWLI